jgi:alpha-galactosidase
MGAHVSAVPNHQVHRITSLEMRGNVAMSGNFGYELDLTKFSDAEKDEVSKQVKAYKEVRQLIQYGELYRLLNPFKGNETAWMFVSEDKHEAFVAYFRVLAIPNAPRDILRLKGLDSEKDYKIVGTDFVLGGDVLMNAGIYLPELNGDFQSYVFRLEAL